MSAMNLEIPVSDLTDDYFPMRGLLARFEVAETTRERAEFLTVATELFAAHAEIEKQLDPVSADDRALKQIFALIGEVGAVVPQGILFLERTAELKQRLQNYVTTQDRWSRSPGGFLKPAQRNLELLGKRERILQRARVLLRSQQTMLH